MSNARKLADNLPSVGQLSGRNVITNGSMSIDQRNSGSAVTPATDAYYTIDRFRARLNNASKYSVQQVTDAPSGFLKSLKITSLAATTVGTNDYYQINTALEGYNVTQLDLGLSSAKKLTLSFWVKSSLTGTFGGAYSNNVGNRFYAWTYTISSANTWEHKTITVDGVTDGSWERTTGAGLHVYWTLGAGSGVQGSAGSWGTTFKRGPTGATNVVATNGATWQITGVQLEVGSQSTPFEHESYETTLRKCQRYYYTLKALPNGKHIGSCTMRNNQYFYGYPRSFPTPMRIAPTFTYNNVSLYVGDNTNGYNTMSLAAAETDAFSLNGNAAGAVTAAETGHSGLLYIDTYSDRHVTFDAEL